MKKTNLELLDFCLQRQELLADPHFSEMNTLIITSSKDESNTLLDAYNALNEYIFVIMFFLHRRFLTYSPTMFKQEPSIFKVRAIRVKTDLTSGYVNTHLLTQQNVI